MTDMHAFCKDVPQAKEEFERLCLWFGKLMNETIAENAWVLGWEGTEDFFNENKEFLTTIGKKMKVPAFFKLMKEMSHYYAIKNEYQVIGADEANVQVSTVQWDIKDGERFDIGFTGEDGKRTPVPVIIHASSFGSIERTLYGILEKAAKDEMTGKAPMFPLWLSPNQVRVCPVSDKHIDAAKKLAEKIVSEHKIRVDIDDRNESLSYKIRSAERDWVPYIVVVGDKELQAIPNGEKIPVRVRGTKENREMSIDEMVSEIETKTKGMPFRPRYVPMLISMRPKFVSWE
jgi:threonyl-tRNA synthetase